MSQTNFQNFLNLDPEDCEYSSARIAVLPIPYEATVTYGTGTAKGPAAIIDASAQVELYDEELGSEPYRIGVATLDPVDVDGVAPRDLADRVAPAVEKILGDGKIPLVFGGEHSVTPAVFRAVHKRHPDATVVQFDAHADLRAEYEGEPMSHACAMARVREMAPAVQIGIRSISRAGAAWAARDRLPIFFAHELPAGEGWMGRALAAVETGEVYVTIDLDCFDSSLMPSTGTPEPGGMDWYDVTRFLRLLMMEKRVVGIDIVELAPQRYTRAPDFLAAKLAYKCIGYLKEGGRSS